MPREPEQWLALHAYVGQREDDFLRAVLSPALEALAAPSAAFFFLRYWTGGPHLRLRLRGDGAQRAAFRAILSERFGAWIPAAGEFGMPSAAQHQAAAQRFSELERVADEALVTEPSLLERDYRAEYAKYGGPTGVAIAERVWHASSSFVLALNAQSQAAGSRMAPGLQMALAGAHAFGLDPKEAAAFFGDCAAIWQAYCPGPASARFEQGLARQAGGVAALADAVWDLRLPAALRDWHGALVAARAKVAQHAALLATDIADLADQRQLPHYLLKQYMHTNNNRLGIDPTNEWLQARLAQAGLLEHVRLHGQDSQRAAHA